jgi:hypothetical protein
MSLLGNIRTCVAAAIIAHDNSICTTIIADLEIIHIVLIFILRLASVTIMTIGSSIGAFPKKFSFGLCILSNLSLLIGLVLLQFALKQLLKCHLLAYYRFVSLDHRHFIRFHCGVLVCSFFSWISAVIIIQLRDVCLIESSLVVV